MHKRTPAASQIEVHGARYPEPLLKDGREVSGALHRLGPPMNSYSRPYANGAARSKETGAREAWSDRLEHGHIQSLRNAAGHHPADE